MSHELLGSTVAGIYVALHNTVNCHSWPDAAYQGLFFFALAGQCAEHVYLEDMQCMERKMIHVLKFSVDLIT